ncbi:unnamed protein product [Lota lota]
MEFPGEELELPGEELELPGEELELPGEELELPGEELELPGEELELPGEELELPGEELELPGEELELPGEELELPGEELEQPLLDLDGAALGPSTQGPDGCHLRGAPEKGRKQGFYHLLRPATIPPKHSLSSPCHCVFESPGRSLAEAVVSPALTQQERLPHNAEATRALTENQHMAVVNRGLLWET